MVEFLAFLLCLLLLAAFWRFFLAIGMMALTFCGILALTVLMGLQGGPIAGLLTAAACVWVLIKLGENVQ